MTSYKKFTPIEKQIELLESRGLNINDRNKFKWYLESYNYQNLINGYNDFFIVNNNRKENKYKSLATSNGIISLFNFDRSISKYILSNIQNIERKLSTSIAYTIAETMNNKGDNSGKLFNINEKLKNFIFKNLNAFNEVKSKFKEKENKLLLNDAFKSRYKKIEEIPIWFIVIFISFGDLLLILKNLRKNVFFEIIKNSKIHLLNNFSKGELIDLFKIIKNIRNRICHNNVLYNFNTSDKYKKIVIRKFKISNKPKVNLFEIIRIIEILDMGKSNNSLSKIIDQKINEIKDIDPTIINEIKNEIWN